MLSLLSLLTVCVEKCLFWVRPNRECPQILAFFFVFLRLSALADIERSKKVLFNRTEVLILFSFPITLEFPFLHWLDIILMSLLSSSATTLLWYIYFSDSFYLYFLVSSLCTAEPLLILQGCFHGVNTRDIIGVMGDDYLVGFLWNLNFQ